MKKLIKRLATVLLSAIMILTLVACGGTGATGSDPNRKKTKTIKFLHIWPEHSAAFQKIANDFMALNEDVKVEIQITNYSDIQTVLNSQILSQSLPDIFFYWTNQIQGYIDANVLLDLSPYTSGWMDTYLDGGTPSWGLAKRGTAYYSVPLRESGSIVIYNKTFFEDNGLTMADTYQDFVSLLATIKSMSSASNWSPIAVSGTIGGLISQFYYMMQTFNTLIQESYKDPNFIKGLISMKTEDALNTNAKILEKLADMYAKGYFGQAEGKSDDTAIRNFKEGNAPMVYMNYNNLNVLGDVEFEIGYSTVPAPEGLNYRYIHADYDGFCVAKNTKNPEAAVRFLKYLTSKDTMQYFANATNSVIPMDITYEKQSLTLMSDAIHQAGSSLLNQNEIAYSTGNIQNSTVEMFHKYIFGKSSDSARTVAEKIANLYESCIKDAGLNFADPAIPFDKTKDYSWLDID